MTLNLDSFNEGSKKKSNSKYKAALGVSSVVGLFGIGSTLAANISLNGGGNASSFRFRLSENSYPNWWNSVDGYQPNAAAISKITVQSMKFFPENYYADNAPGPGLNEATYEWL